MLKSIVVSEMSTRILTNYSYYSHYYFKYSPTGKGLQRLCALEKGSERWKDEEKGVELYEGI